MARQGKKKQTKPDAKHGGQDHFVGFKLQFLESRALQYQQALDTGTRNPGPFYDKVTLDFLAKFRQDDDFAKDPDEDPPNPWDFLDEEEEEISEAEAEKRTARYNKIQQVSQQNHYSLQRILTVSLQKLAQWYRRKYKRVETGSSSGGASVNPFMSVLDANKGKPPRKISPFHLYFKLHYGTRIKAEYTRRFRWANEEYENATEEERLEKGLTAPVAIALRCKVGREFWMLESEQFRQELSELSEKEHTSNMEAWEVSQKVAKTPQQFHQ
jgi:hypothetical protein